MEKRKKSRDAGHQLYRGRLNAPGQGGTKSRSHAKTDDEYIGGRPLQESQRQMNHHFGDWRQGGDADAIDQEPLTHTGAGRYHGGRVVAAYLALGVLLLISFGRDR